MNKNLQSPTKLTEFAPLSPEPEESPGITYLLTKLFKRGSSSSGKITMSVNYINLKDIH